MTSAYDGVGTWLLMAARLTDGTPRARLTLAIDLAALALFVVVGMRSHTEGAKATIFLRNVVPVGVAWLICAATFAAYRGPSLRSLVKTWLVAVPVGLAVRTVWVGSPAGARIAVFFAVAMAFTALFLVIGRLVSAFVASKLPGEETA
jgi:Protein of unknown function (DUF3054).